VGAAIYGNAGAYGQSIAERIEWVRFADGAEVRQFGRAECGFRYRESIFKQNKSWQILSAGLRLEVGEAAVLQAKSASIRATRDAKFPPTMQCAGSIFKNLLLRELPVAVAAQVPANVIREGKIPAGWFLEEVGAKGLAVGAMRVADYHANLVYNTGGGTAADLVALLSELKRRVFDRFGLEIEEEVQFLS
jgi:UDP-N-acetylmuramate dehydrogenase